MPALSKAKQLQSKKKRKVYSPTEKIKRKLDKLAPKKCRELGHCTICKKENCVLNAHHYKSKIYKGTRWYQPNLICLCVHCHLFNFKFSAHRTPEAFKTRMIELKGQEWADDIQKRANDHTSFKKGELEELLTKLKK